MASGSRPPQTRRSFEHEETTNLSWVKLDDQFHWHPKVASLSSDAYRLFIGGLCVCNSHRTGGVIWRSRFGMAAEGVKAPKKALGELLEAGIWLEIEGGWEVHDYGVYQLTSEAAREAAREAGRKSGESRRHRTANAPLNETRTKPERTVQRSVERNPNEIEPATQARAPAQARALDPLPEPSPVVPTGLRPSGTPNPVPVASPPPTPPLRGGDPGVTVLTGAFAGEFEAFVAELNGATGRRFRGDSEGRKLYARVRRSGRSVDDLLAAARGVALSRHHAGQNDAGLPYNAPANVLRSRVLDQLIALGQGEIQPHVVMPRSVEEAVGYDRAWADHAANLRREGQ